MNNSEFSELLATLKRQMTVATYDTHLTGCRLINVNELSLTIAVLRPSSIPWLERLSPTIANVAHALTGHHWHFEFVYAPTPTLITPPAPPLPAPPEFAGFEAINSNFVTMPKQFFEQILPNETPTVSCLVAMVAYQTIGVIVNYRTGQRREWWIASYADIQRACNISAGSVPTAIRRAVHTMRYVVQDDAPFNRKRYRLRFETD